MQSRKSDAQASPRLRVVDAKWNNDLVTLAGDGHFAVYVFVVVTMFRENQQHRRAPIERVGNLIVEAATRSYIARCDPAPHAAALQLANDFQRRRLVFAHVADKQERIGVHFSLGASQPYIKLCLCSPCAKGKSTD